jgi:CRISPR-associated protein Csm2
MSNENVIEDIKRDLDSILDEDSENSEKLVNNAEKLGRHLGRVTRMSTSQIRNIYSDVKQMQKFKPYELNLLRPKMAYAAKRNPQTKDLQEVLDLAIRKIDNQKKFEKFKDFFEAIVAYHYSYGKE